MLSGMSIWGSRKGIVPCSHRLFASVTVLGAGVSGTTIVAMLVDAGHEVSWIDDRHEDVGRMGRFFSRGVPSNTQNRVLLKGLQEVAAFRFEDFILNKRNSEIPGKTLIDLPEDSCADLKFLYEPLHFASENLRSHAQVNVVKGKLIRADYMSDEPASPWKFTVAGPRSTSIHSSYFFMAPGAVPSFPSNIPSSYPCESVDEFVNAHSVMATMMKEPKLRSEPWAVVGSSHR